MNKKNLILDLRGAVLELERKGKKTSVTEISKECGISMTTLRILDKGVTKALRVIYELIQENPKLTFNKIVNDKILFKPFQNNASVKFVKAFLTKYPEIEFIGLIKEV